MRAQTTDLIQDTTGKFVHFSLHEIPVCDLVGSKKQNSTFGNPCESKIDHEGMLLSNLAAECKSCKDKETNKAIRLQMAKQKQEVGTAAFLYLAQHQMYLSHEWMLPKAQEE